MLTYVPDDHQKHAIQARLNLMLGASEFDRLFLGFEIDEVHGEVLYASARSEYCADMIAERYPLEVAKAAEDILGLTISFVQVMSKRHDPQQP